MSLSVFCGKNKETRIIEALSLEFNPIGVTRDDINWYIETFQLTHTDIKVIGCIELDRVERQRLRILKLKEQEAG